MSASIWGPTSATEAVSFGTRLSTLAAAQPTRPALIIVGEGGAEASITWAALDRRSNRVARRLADEGVGARSMVAIGLPNGATHFVASFATWKLGACALPLDPRLPLAERQAILALAKPDAVVADWGASSDAISGDDLEASTHADSPLPLRVPHPGKAVASGGSTGRPKVIVDPAPWARRPGELVEAFGPLSGFRAGQIQLVCGPLYHNAPFSWSHFGLFEGHRLIVMTRFDAAEAVDLIERHRVQYMVLVPTMMQRVVRLDGIALRDLSSVESVFHTAAPCPAWVKLAWIELIGAGRVREAYGSTENTGAAVIAGDEWLRHRGSVGRPYGCDLRIVDERGREVPTGVVGEIFMRPHVTRETYRYLGAERARATVDGFATVGDLGWVDAEGYLFIADRRVDLIVSGGVNVYPAEVEAALIECHHVRDVAVIGLPDNEWGQRVHAIIEPRDLSHPPDIHDLKRHCRERLAAPKVPKTYEFVQLLPRNEAGKIRRRDLVTARRPAP